MVPVSSATESTITTATEEIKPEDGDREPRGDPEMAPLYLRKMLPIFAQVYNNTMMPSVRWGIEWMYSQIFLKWQ